MINMDNYEEQSIFGFPEYKITKKIRLIEMFGGIGSQAMALRDIGADGNFCKTEDAQFFVNKEPIARTVTCKCGGGRMSTTTIWF